MKGNGNPALLAEPGTADLTGFTQHDRSFWYEYVLMVVGIHGIRHKDLDRAYGIAVKTVHQNGVERQTLIDYIGLAHCLVDIDLCRTFVVRGGYLLTCGSRGGQAGRLTGLTCRREGIWCNRRSLRWATLLLSGQVGWTCIGDVGRESGCIYPLLFSRRKLLSCLLGRRELGLSIRLRAVRLPVRGCRIEWTAIGSKSRRCRLLCPCTARRWIASCSCELRVLLRL